jgi:flavorubredoxin
VVARALDAICTSHGIIWRDNPLQILQKYTEWANAYQENQVTLIYDTMWNGTRIMAENIAKGIHMADKTINVKLFNASNTDKNDILTEVFPSKAIFVGSPTINKGILFSIAGIMAIRVWFKIRKQLHSAVTAGTGMHCRHDDAIKMQI